MYVEGLSLIYYHKLELRCLYDKTDCVMVHSNIVETNITTLILILPNGLGLVILYTMKYEIQSVYRAVVLRNKGQKSNPVKTGQMVPDPVRLSVRKHRHFLRRALAIETRTTFLAKPNVWQTQKLLEPLFHHGMEISNAVFYATL